MLDKIVMLQSPGYRVAPSPKVIQYDITLREPLSNARPAGSRCDWDRIIAGSPLKPGEVWAVLMDSRDLNADAFFSCPPLAEKMHVQTPRELFARLQGLGATMHPYLRDSEVNLPGAETIKVIPKDLCRIAYDEAHGVY